MPIDRATLRPNICRRVSRLTGREMWNVVARRGKVRIYLGSYPSAEQGRAAFDAYVITGEKPPKQRRGVKPMQRLKPRARKSPQPRVYKPHQRAASERRLIQPSPQPQPKIDRLEMMRRIAARLS